MTVRTQIMAALAESKRALRATGDDNRFDVVLNDEVVGHVTRERRQTATGSFRTMWYPYDLSGRAVNPWSAYTSRENAGRGLVYEHLRRCVTNVTH